MCQHFICRAGNLEIMQGEHTGNTVLSQREENRRRNMMVNIVQMRDLRLNLINKFLYLSGGLEGVGDLKCVEGFSRKGIFSSELNLIHEIILPLCRLILWVLHRERHYIPSQISE